MYKNKRLQILLLLGLISSNYVYANRGAGATVRITTAQGEQLDLYKHSYALLIEVSDYRNGWSSLPLIPKELDAVQTVLEAQGFTVTRIRNPNEEQLKKAFDSFIDNYGYEEQNRLLFFYSGHGYSFPNQSKGYLVPVDAPNPNDDKRGFLSKAVSMNHVLTWARNITAKHALFLFDSCFSGSIFQSKGLITPKYISQLSAKPVRQFITAGSASDEVPAKSTFTPAFVDGLKYKLADMDKDGYITGMELGRYLQKVVPQSVRQMPQYGTIQDYELRMGDFIFSLNQENRAVTSGYDTSSSTVESSSYVKSDSYTGMEFVRVKPGCFQMGNDAQEDDEKPVHQVCISQRYDMGIYEVTQAQWEKVMGNNPSRFKGNNKPIHNVSWEDVQIFIVKLNQKTGQHYRLPTEAEWEYACRGDKKNQHYCGGNDVNSVGWNYDNSGKKRMFDKLNQPHEVGQKQVNGFGIYDMSGNVWEWVQDWYGEDYYKNSVINDPKGLTSGQNRVSRGGGWGLDESYSRSANRDNNMPDTRKDSLGFRLVRQP